MFSCIHFPAMGCIAPAHGCFHCCFSLVIMDLSVVTVILFTGKYTSATCNYIVAVVFCSNRQLLSVQIAPDIKQKENVMHPQCHFQRSPESDDMSFGDSGVQHAKPSLQGRDCDIFGETSMPFLSTLQKQAEDIEAP